MAGHNSFIAATPNKRPPGVDWSLGSLTVGANAQYFGSYLIYAQADVADFLAPYIAALQGSNAVPAQTYVDLDIRKRLHLRERGFASDVNVDFGVENVLDAEPPRETTFFSGGPGYSRYGDPRQRRFQLSLSALF